MRGAKLGDGEEADGGKGGRDRSKALLTGFITYLYENPADGFTVAGVVALLMRAHREVVILVSILELPITTR